MSENLQNAPKEWVLPGVSSYNIVQRALVVLYAPVSEEMEKFCSGSRKIGASSSYHVHLAPMTTYSLQCGLYPAASVRADTPFRLAQCKFEGHSLCFESFQALQLVDDQGDYVSGCCSDISRRSASRDAYCAVAQFVTLCYAAGQNIQLMPPFDISGFDARCRQPVQ